MVLSGSQLINAAFVTKVPFDLTKAYAPITQAVSGPYLLIVNPAVAAQSVKELVALAKAKPGQLNYATSGTGSFAHLGMELFKNLTGTDMVHVPYKGSGPAMIDLIGGQVQVAMASATSSMPHVRSGRLRALAVTTLKRSPLIPELPSIAEAGVPGYSIDSWYGIVAPAKTSPAVVNKLNAEIVRALKSPNVAAHLVKEGSVPVGSSPAEFASTIQAEIAKWAKVIAAAKLKFE
jgi:tripartite-type tricarboxylate transporter receptor subunit TctC